MHPESEVQVSVVVRLVTGVDLGPNTHFMIMSQQVWDLPIVRSVAASGPKAGDQSG